MTTEHFWDCECDKNYIHPKTEKFCKHCESLENEQPDSRILEVIALLLGELKRL